MQGLGLQGGLAVVGGMVGASGGECGAGEASTGLGVWGGLAAAREVSVGLGR